MHIRDLPENASEWLWAADLKGKDVTLTIASVGIETLRNVDGSELKTVIRFKEMEGRKPEDQKRLALNKTNIKSVARQHGTETDGWVGKKITLYPTTTKAFGEMVECIRIRDKAKVRPV